MRAVRTVIFVLAAISAGVVAALTASQAPAQQGASAKVLQVTATTGMVADTVARVAGDRAKVQALMGPAVDPHLFRPTRTDIAKLAGADVIFYNGLYLEAQMEALLADLATRKPVVAIAERVPQDRLLANADYPDKLDPHVWMDPKLWAHAVEAVRDALIAADEAGRDQYTANAARMISELDRLAQYANTSLGSVPEGQRVLVTAHDAFNYFGRAYNFQVLGIQGISTESEAGLRQIEDMVATLVERNIRAIFVETSVSDRNVKALIEGAAARGHTVTIGGELYSDAMGAAGTYEGTFIGMIDHNATVITRALGGDAPARGLNGQLSVGS